MFKKFSIDSMKEKTKSVMNHEAIQKGMDSLKDTAQNIKESETFTKVNERINDVTHSETFITKKETITNSEIFQTTVDKTTEVTTKIKETSEVIIQSDKVQQTVTKTNELSQKFVDVSKETYTNSRKKFLSLMTDNVELDTLINPDPLKSKVEKYDFLYQCKRKLNHFDPYLLIVEQAEKLARDFEGLYLETLPFGRTLAFNSEFNSELNSIAFFPIASQNLTEMKEYGLMINTNSIILKSEFNDSFGLFGKDIKKNSKNNIIECIYFDRIIDVNKLENYLEIQYYDQHNEGKIIKLYDKYKVPLFNQRLGELLKFASHFDYGDIIGESSSEKTYESLKNEQSESDGLFGGLNHSLTGKLNHQLNQIDYAYHEAKNYTQGAGYYAEYINAELLNTPLNKVEIVAKSNTKHAHGRGDNAADFKLKNRFTGKTAMVQLKYKASPSALAKDIMHYENPVMIPPDRYVDTVKVLKSKYNLSDREIKKRVIKGKITYDANLKINQSFAKKAGLDALMSAKQAVTPAAVVALCTMTIAIWQGKDVQETAKLTLKNSGKSFALSTSIGAVSRIAGRANAVRIANSTVSNKTQASQKFASTFGRAMTVSIIAVSLAPDVTNAINGKITNKQLAKTLITTGAGLAAGAVGGLGAIPLAMVAVDVTSQMFDKYVKDDVLLNYQIYKEVFIELATKYMLSQTDIEALINETFGSETFNEVLIELQLNFGNYRWAKYNYVYEQMELLVDDIIQRTRKEVSEEDIQLLLEIL